METNELYRRYLLSDRMAKIVRSIAEDTGIDVKLNGVDLHDAGRDRDKESAIWAYDVRLSIGTHFLRPEQREVVVDELLTRLPELNLSREQGTMRVGGLIQGLLVRSYLGEGVCERVVVGTRVVPAREEYVEEIIEVRCPDPITATLNA